MLPEKFYGILSSLSVYSSEFVCHISFLRLLFQIVTADNIGLPRSPTFFMFYVLSFFKLVERLQILYTSNKPYDDRLPQNAHV